MNNDRNLCRIRSNRSYSRRREIKSQKAQSEDLDKVRQSIAKSETKMGNVEGIVLKMLDRWNRSDETSQRHREDIIKELNDVTDDLSYLKGKVNSK
jgi:hypothetical protein